MFSPFRSSQRKLGPLAHVATKIPAFAGMSGVVLMLSACATTSGQSSEAYLAKQKIAESVHPDSGGGYCPTEHSMGPFSKEYFGVSQEAFPKLQTEGVSTKTELKERVNIFAKQVSYSATPVEVKEINCWTGEIYWLADIGELKNPAETWIRVLSGFGAKHKCTYSEDPNAWTTEPCPSVKGSVG